MEEDRKKYVNADRTDTNTKSSSRGLSQQHLSHIFVSVTKFTSAYPKRQLREKAKSKLPRNVEHYLFLSHSNHNMKHKN